MSDPLDLTSNQTPEEAIEALQQELAATNVLLVSLSRELQADRVETAVRVEGLRAEQHRERRVRMMAVAAGGFGIIYAHDEHIEHCSPGSRVVNGIDYLITHPPKPGDTPEARQEGFTQQYNDAPWFCDVSFPLHTHDGSSFPSVDNAIGMTLLGLLILGTAVYHRLKTVADFHRVREAAKMEEASSRDL